MREFERCLGLPVIALDVAEERGVTTHFVLDPWANRVVGFVVSGINGLAEKRAFRFGDVVSFGEDVIVLETQESLVPVSRVEEMRPCLSPTEEQPRRVAWTTDGQRLGTILGRSFDERTAELLDYTLWPREGEPVVIPASATVSSAKGMALFRRDLLPLEFPVTAPVGADLAPVTGNSDSTLPDTQDPPEAADEIGEIPSEDEAETEASPAYAVMPEEEAEEILQPVSATLEPEEAALEPEPVTAEPEEDVAEESDQPEVPVRAAEEEIAPVADDPDEEVPVEFVAGSDTHVVVNGNGHEHAAVNGNGHAVQNGGVEEPVALNGNGSAPVEAEAETVSVPMNGRASEVPETAPANGNGHKAVTANGNGHSYDNGNGHSHSNGNGNGHSHAHNGESNGHAAQPTSEERIDEQVRRFMPLLVGCYVSRDIRNDMGETVIYQGQEVTPEIVLAAWKVNRLFDLYTASQTPSKAVAAVH